MDLNKIFDQKIKNNKELFLSYADLVEEAKLKENITIAGQIMPSILRPYFLPKAQEKILQNDMETLFTCLEIVAEEYPDNKEIRKIIGLTKKEEELAMIDPGYHHKHILIARPDCFYDGKNFQIAEFNSDSPAGAGYIAAFYEKVLKRVRPMKQWLEHSDSRYINPLANMEKMVRNSWQEFAGTSRLPTVAWVEWEDAKTWSEFAIEMEYFSQKGYRYIMAEPRQLKYKKGGLYKGNIKIDVIRKRAITTELAERSHQIKDLVRAIQEVKVCLVNPLRSKVVSNKSTLHILTHPDFAYLFNKAQLEAIHKLVPVTRIFKKGKEDMGRYGQVDMVSFAKKNQHKFILKPYNLYGGKGVCLGKNCSAAEWNKAINEALKGGWMIQELVKIPVETFPWIENDKLKFVKRFINLNPFVFGGKFSGAIIRCSTKEVINVSAGGGLGAVCFEK